MLKNKKGTIAMYGTAFGLLLAIIVFFYYSSQTDKYMTNYGLNQTKIILAYQAGERALLYVDQAAKISMQQGAYELAKYGFYSKEGFDSAAKLGFGGEQFAYWKDESVGFDPEKQDCAVTVTENYPRVDDESTNANFWSITHSHLSQQLGLAKRDIPDSYNSFRTSRLSGGTTLSAEASEPIVISNAPVIYKVRPSFKQSIILDFLGALYNLETQVAGKKREEVESYGFSIGKLATPGTCVIVHETDPNAAECCLRLEDCHKKKDVTEEETAELEPCPCAEYGKERVYKNYVKYDYAISSNSGTSYFVDTASGVKNTPVVYKFALGWAEINDAPQSVCVRVG